MSPVECIKQLIEYVKQEEPHLIEEFARKNTPFYYEPGVKYHPITSGYGCGSGGSRDTYEIDNADYLKSGEMHITMVPDNRNKSKGVMTMSKAHKQFKRVDETVKPAGRSIKNSGRNRYMTVNGVEWFIYFSTWRDYSTKKLQTRVIFRGSNAQNTNIWGRSHSEYWEVYTAAGKGYFILKHVYNYDSVGRENYRLHDLSTGISVREIKQKVFGDPNVKLVCELFNHLR